VLSVDCRVKPGNDEIERDRGPSRFPDLVTTGLDPVVHAAVRAAMDCQVKPGNDARKTRFQSSKTRSNIDRRVVPLGAAKDIDP
jgi:hypothetical protein